MKRNILSVILLVVLVVSLIACSDDSKTTKKMGMIRSKKALGKKDAKIGVAMPTKDLQRWNQDGANMKAELESAGYEVDLQYANNEIATQLSQVENMITGGCDVLVIASIDGSSLEQCLKKQKMKIFQ